MTDQSESSDHSSTYSMRGERVMRLSKSEIERRARSFCRALGLGSRGVKQPIVQAIEGLRVSHGIPLNLDAIYDDEWELYGIAEALCDPRSLSILMPNSLYIRVANNDPEALLILFHELGHIFLGHTPVLHYRRDTAPVKEEDAEWQADVFAESALRRLMPKQVPSQLELF